MRCYQFTDRPMTSFNLFNFKVTFQSLKGLHREDNDAPNATVRLGMAVMMSREPYDECANPQGHQHYSNTESQTTPITAGSSSKCLKRHGEVSFH